MKKYVFDKLLQYLIVLCAASLIIFFMVRLNKTDPVSVIVGGKQTTPETVANIRREFNLDRSLPEQYGIWVTNFLKGDLGKSFQYRQSVETLIANRSPVTAGLVVMATLISVLISIPTGIFTAVKHNSPADTVINVIELILVACPPFLTSIVMIWIVTTIAPTFSFTGSFKTFGEFIQRLSLPSLALAFSMIALTSRVMKNSMIEELHSDYALVAKAKGLSLSQTISQYCLKNAIIPVLTILGTQIGILITGAVLVENVFSLAGLGSILVEGIKAADYPVVQGITMLLVFVFLTISTVLDILYGIIDPRIRMQ